MDGPRDYHVNEAKLRKTNISLIHGTKKKKKDTNEFIYKTEIDLQTQKTKLWLPKKKGMA